MPYTQIVPNLRFTTADWINSLGNHSKSVSRQNFTGTRTGERVLGWRNLVRAGLQAGSDYSTDRYTDLRFVEGTASSQYFETLGSPSIVLRSGFEGVTNPLGPVNHISWNTSAMESAALSRLYSKIRSERTRVNGMNILGELRQTIQMFRRPAAALREHVDKYFLSLENRKRKVLSLPVHKRRAEWEKAVSGSILEWNFGWKPVVSDTLGIAEALGRVVTKAPKRNRLMTRGQEEQCTVTSDGPFVSPNSCYIVYNLHTKIKTTRRIQYITGNEYIEAVAQTAAERLREQLGFTTENFVPTIYELTPWSWLVDYFTNVGKILEAATTDTSSVKWIIKTISVITEAERHSAIDIDGTAGYMNAFGYTLKSCSGVLGHSKLIRRSVTRTMPSTLGLPSLIISHPGDSPSKMANVLSVMAQRRKGLQDLSSMPNLSSRSLVNR